MAGRTTLLVTGLRAQAIGSASATGRTSISVQASFIRHADADINSRTIVTVSGTIAKPSGAIGPIAGRTIVTANGVRAKVGAATITCRTSVTATVTLARFASVSAAGHTTVTVAAASAQTILQGFYQSVDVVAIEGFPVLVDAIDADVLALFP